VLITLFLGSLGVSSLVPLYHIIRRRDPESVKGWSFVEGDVQCLTRPEPRVRIRPVRTEALVCQICMGKLKIGLPHVVCDCGKVFHISCLKRTGFCPYCHKAYAPSDVDTMATLPDDDSVECPICGRSVYSGSGSCECGAIIADEQGAFYCPGCGTHIEDGETDCPFCGERFEDVCLVKCPFCGRVFDEKKGMCECGMFVGESCPECGIRLTLNDSSCPSCGVSFEVLKEC